MPKVKSAIEEEPNDSFTSMIDIVFLLLIFFILQPFKSPEMRIDSDLPKDSGPSTTPDTPRQHIQIFMEVDANNKEECIYKVDDITLGSSLANAGDKIHVALKRKSGGVLDTPIALMPQLDVHFIHVLKALDQCAVAKMADVKWNGPPLKGYKPAHLREGGE